MELITVIVYLKRHVQKQRRETISSKLAAPGAGPPHLSASAPSSIRSGSELSEHLIRNCCAMLPIKLGETLGSSVSNHLNGVDRASVWTVHYASACFETASLPSLLLRTDIQGLQDHRHIGRCALKAIMAANIPLVTELFIDAMHFDDFSLDVDAMITAALRMFMELGMVQKFKIDYETLCRWLLTVRKNYRMVLYHNWRHAFNVCQLMFAMLTTAGFQEILTETEILALIVGCLCHDLDHRGTNNAFQAKSGSALSQLYGTSATLEHHHFNHAVMILQSEPQNDTSFFHDTYDTQSPSHQIDSRAFTSLLSSHMLLQRENALSSDIFQRGQPLTDNFTK
ncbi:dual 3, 5 -cyclic-AMP and -GMP phosphodiesterase 11A [Pelobates cultripes]|uniref:Dual 3,5 -cyclic-AMP and -GMP phosphodiesterase 11A, partial n=1 Tax=Pelobates cultripes TaxID=61616 RepID=A0AAD1SPS5_PELCU|nr:dual 3, 5 -cyclic-AMP and -GMP phosphodiesterase 11A [Pelobates cultripes]